MERIIAADIGGTHISLACFEKTKTQLSLKKTLREEVDATLEKVAILESWNNAIKRLDSGFSNSFFALAIPAPFDYENGISWIKEQGKFTGLYGVNLKDELSQSLLLPSNRIRFLNDAESFLRGEVYFGKAQAYQNVLGLTLGTGLGSAFKADEKVKDAGLWCAKFKNGIAEDYLGTNWFVEYGHQNFGLTVSGVKDLIDCIEDKEILSEIFNEFAQNLADFITIQFQEFKFDAVVLGGNILKASKLFLDQTMSILKKQGISVPLLESELGEKSALFGAATIYFNGEHENKKNGYDFRNI